MRSRIQAIYFVRQLFLLAACQSPTANQEPSLNKLGAIYCAAGTPSGTRRFPWPFAAEPAVGLRGSSFFGGGRDQDQILAAFYYAAGPKQRASLTSLKAIWQGANPMHVRAAHDSPSISAIGYAKFSAAPGDAVIRVYG